MAGKKIVQHSFNRGINRDIHPRFQPEGTYRHALNMQKSTTDFYSGGLTNELWDKMVARIPGEVVGAYTIEERNQTLFFHIDGGNTLSLFDHGTFEVTKVGSDSEFGCDWKFSNCKFITYGRVDSKSLAPCNDLIVYWSSGDIYHKVNIDELLHPKRRESIKLKTKPCDHFLVFTEKPTPRLKARKNRGGGRDLPPGQYFVVARTLDESENSSNWGPIEGPIYLGSKYNKFTDTSRESIQIEAKFLSDKFSRIQIAVIPPIGSASRDVAHIIYDGSYNTNGVTANYYSQSQHKEDVPMSEILEKDIKYLKGAGLIASRGRLHLSETLQEFNPPVQKWVAQSRIYPVAFAVPASEAHRFKTFRPDEVYAFGQAYQYTDQTWTAWAHIYGPEAGPNELLCGECNLPKGHTSNNAKILETYNTIQGSKEGLCITGGQKTTQGEGYSPTLSECSAEQQIDTRTTINDDCVDQTTQREAMQEEIETMETRSESLDNCIDCGETTSKADLNRTENMFVRNLENMTDLFRTDKEVAEDCTTGKHDNQPAAAKTLYEEAIQNAEDDEEIEYRTIVKKTGGSNTKVEKGKDSSVLIVGTTKGEDCVTDEVEPIVLAKFQAGGWESTFIYPKTLDCDGEPLFGENAGLPIRHFKMPDGSLMSLFYSSQRGVESRHDPSNIPGKDTYVVLIGIQVENVYIPSYEAGEIPKPLDANTPWKIGIVKRERHNQSVIASGYFINTFKGFIGGKEYAVPRHAANAYPNIDRTILTEDGKHMGEDWDQPIYMFYSPDIQNSAEFINADYVKIEAKIRGDGYMYGLYVEGKDVPDEQHRLDRRCARGAMSFMSRDKDFTPFQTCVSGMEFAEHHSTLQNPEGINFPLINRYRESGVFLQTVDRLPTVGAGGKDKSFNVGGLDHEYATAGEILYGSLKRFNSQQFGSIESLQYVDVGVSGRKDITSIRVLTGDSFVQKWSHKRTSYISDSVGDKINVDYPITADPEFLGPAGTDGRDRGVTDPPNRRGYRMLEFFGFWNPLELPKNGDKRDPKNMANGHPTLSAQKIWGSLDDFGGIVDPVSDMFYARTLTQLNHLVVATDVNLKYRSTSEPATREIFYEQLQGVEVDSSINNVDPEDSWLPDWHNQHKQPTRKQLEKKARIRFALIVGGFLLGAGAVAGVSTALQLGTTMLMGASFGVIWAMLVYNVLTGKKLDRLLGFPPYREDADGAKAEDNTRGLKDNWNAYNHGFSAVNDLNLFFGMPANYNTCKCPDEYSNVIYSSNSQIDTSPHDAWDNFQALSFFGIRGDSGQVKRLFLWGNNLYAQTTDATFLLPQGQDGIIGEPSKIMDGVTEGVFGTLDPNAGRSCRYGYVTVDYRARDFYIFDGSAKTINGRDSGLYHFWKDNFTFCNSGCRDQMMPRGTHYAIGYDPERELLLISKHDGAGGVTYSYDLVDKKFISEHSYVPDFYFWDRNKLFYVKDGKIFRMNEPGGYTIYGGKKYSSRVDTVTRTDTSEAFTYDSTVLDTDVTEIDTAGRPRLLDREETFSSLVAWTEFCLTGKKRLVLEDQEDAQGQTKETDDLRISRRELGKWKLNDLLSVELDRDTPVTAHLGCGRVEEPVLTNFDDFPDTHKNKTIKGKYLIQRYEFNKNNKQICLMGMNVHVSVPDEK